MKLKKKHKIWTFEVEIPMNLSDHDTYNFAMCTLLNSSFNFLSGEYIFKLDYKII